MEKKIIHNSDNTAMIVTGLRTSAIVTFKNEPRASSPLIKELAGTSSKIALWGDDNDFPQKVIEDVRKDPEIGPLLEKKAELMCGGGIVWGIQDFKDDGTEFLKPLASKDNKIVSKWMERSRINTRYFIEAATDLFWFYNVFPEVILNVGRTEIIQLAVQAAETCRWSKQNTKGIVENCYINANFPNVRENDKETITLPVLDPYYAPAESLKEMRAKSLRFIYPLSYPTPGCTYYQLATWNGIRESKWLEVSQALPKFKLNLMENQLNIKYHIEISDLYWPIRYPDWDQLNPQQQKTKVDAELKNFSDIMTGVEKAGNSLITAMKTDFNNQIHMSMWKITVIDDKIKNGQFLEEGKDASLYKAAAIGLHSALTGTTTNSGLGGAGSNIREAYNLNSFMNRPKQDILLEPLNLVRDFNGWNDEIVFRISNPFMTTLDQGKEVTAGNKPNPKN